MELNSSHHQPLHLALFPWLSLGHILPYLELSKAIAKRGHKVSLISTPGNLKRIPKIPTHLSSSIDLVELHLPTVHGLPEGAEATCDVPIENVHYLLEAFDGLMPQVIHFLKGASPKPDWIIHDFVQHWMGDVSKECNIPCAHFCVNTAPNIFWGGPDELMAPTRTRLEDYIVKPEWVPFRTKVALKPHEARLILGIGLLSGMRRTGKAMQHCKLVVMRDCEELHSEWIRVFEDVFKKPILPAGILPPSPEEIDLSVSSPSTTSKIMQWLEKQPPASVLYIAFGAEVNIDFAIIRELVLGLELSGVPFLWGFRKPRNISDKENTFLEEFQNRNRVHNLIVTDWVPQLKVLSHQSVGGFLTHCGASSTIEGLMFGRPLISLPIMADHWITSRDMAEKNVVLEMERDEEDGSITKEAVVKAVRTVMVEEEGEVFRAAARKISEIYTDYELQDRYVDRFVQALAQYGC